jgi:hypothetical protein
LFGVCLNLFRCHQWYIFDLIVFIALSSRPDYEEHSKYNQEQASNNTNHCINGDRISSRGRATPRSGKAIRRRRTSIDVKLLLSYRHLRALHF